MKKIGPTFASELDAAGVLIIPMSWGEDGDIQFSNSVTEKQRKTVLAVLDAHDPGKEIPVKDAKVKLAEFLAVNKDVMELLS